MASLYPYLILIGLSIIAATSWLLRQARGRAEITNELVKLNQTLDFDLPDFLRACWKPLQKAGFRGVSWQLDWFGSKLALFQGKEGEVIIERTLQVQDISLTIKLYEGNRRFEQRYFSTVLSESFFLLLYTDMWVKLGTVQGAFAQTAKMNVFLQHDMKNIVQLVSLMTEQLEMTPTGQEGQLIDGLKTVMPTLRDRSERFLSTLSNNVPTETVEAVDMRQALMKTAAIHELKVVIKGEAGGLISEQSLSSLFDNIFGNYIDQGRRNPNKQLDLHVKLVQEKNSSRISILDRSGAPCLWPERLFEPFWSEKGDGLGIGLYHARQLVTGLGGSFVAETPSDGPLTFVITLPN